MLSTFPHREELHRHDRGVLEILRLPDEERDDIGVVRVESHQQVWDSRTFPSGSRGRGWAVHKGGAAPGSVPPVSHPLPVSRLSSRPYSALQRCLEDWAESFNYSYPNALAEQYIFQSHHRYFHNCTLEQPVYFDPPEDVLLAMIIAPICLIPFLVTLVIWRSKDGKAQA